MALVHFCHVAFLSPAVCPLSWTQLVIRRAYVFMEWPTPSVHGAFIYRPPNSSVTLSEFRIRLRGGRQGAAPRTRVCVLKERIAIFFPLTKLRLDLEAVESLRGEIFLSCSERPLSHVYERLVKLRLIWEESARSDKAPFRWLRGGGARVGPGVNFGGKKRKKEG